MSATSVRLRALFFLVVLAAAASCRSADVNKPVEEKDVIQVQLSPALASWSEALGSCGEKLEHSGLVVESLPVDQLSLDESDLILKLGQKSGAEPSISSPGSVSARLVQNSKNPSDQISMRDFSALLSGQKTIWEEAGGKTQGDTNPDLEPVLVSLGSGHDLTVWLRGTFLSGAEINVRTLVAGSSASLLQQIADTPGSFALLPAREVPPGTKTLALLDANGAEISLEIPILAITAAQPEGDLRQLLLCLQELQWN